MKRSLALTIVLTLLCSSVCFSRVVKQYFTSGKLYSSQVYYDNGKEKGPTKIYWPNGRLRQETLYKKGLPYVTHAWSVYGVRLR